MTARRRKGDAPGQGGEEAKQNTAKRRDYSSRSTTTDAQLQRILTLLRIGSKTSHDLLRAGIYHPPRRIRDLRERGNVIATTRVTLTDRDGFEHRGCAEYTLISEAH